MFWFDVSFDMSDVSFLVESGGIKGGLSGVDGRYSARKGGLSRFSTDQASVAAESEKGFSKHHQTPAGRRKSILKRSDRMRLC